MANFIKLPIGKFYWEASLRAPLLGCGCDDEPGGASLYYQSAYDSEKRIEIPASVLYEGSLYAVEKVNITHESTEWHSLLLPLSAESVRLSMQKISQIEYQPETTISGCEYMFSYCQIGTLPLWSNKQLYHFKKTTVDTLIVEKETTRLRLSQLEPESIKNLVIRSPGMKKLYGYASETPFKGVVSLESVHIEQGVEIIPAYSFYGCKRLRTVTLSQTVKRIGRSAFADCHPDLQLEYIKPIEGEP
ncbi:MAG: leucine-rich repeat protein [Planctomycetia bacterium]|nr:leucine-rich repeat protein [Planctomycetia bacterium]